jgi:hypothetical protein
MYHANHKKSRKYVPLMHHKDIGHTAAIAPWLYILGKFNLLLVTLLPVQHPEEFD